MFALTQEKHLIYFDQRNQYQAKYNFVLRKPEIKTPQQENMTPINSLTFQIKAEGPFQFSWKSDSFQIEHKQPQMQFGRCPISLDNYLQIYQNPLVHTFTLNFKAVLSLLQQQSYFGQVGQLMIQTNFNGNIFRLPLQMIESESFNYQSYKKVCVIVQSSDSDMVITGGKLIGYYIFAQVDDFKRQNQNSKAQLKVYEYQFDDRVDADHIVVAKGSFKCKEVSFQKSIIRIYSAGQEIEFMPTLLQVLLQIKPIMGQIEPLTIIQHANTHIKDAYRMVFFRDINSLPVRVYRSYLYDKVKDRWLIQGMVHYKRSNKYFQDIMKELTQLISEGEQLMPLQVDTYCFDRVWKLKATFFYHVLSNFKALRDYGSASLASLIIEQAQKGKLSSQILFKKLKNKYGLKNFRTIYEQQFVKCTGLNRIFYQIYDLQKQNKVKIIVRQKALVNKVFRLYNMFRIKLEQQFQLITPLTQRIMAKNKFIENKKKELSGPLAIPKSLNCLPYFRGHLTVQTDASDMPFELELRQENIIEEKQNVTSKVRTPIRKIGQVQKSSEGLQWIMVDTAHIFPAVYKNQNVKEAALLQKIKKKYDSEHEEIKVLNCISSRDHSNSQKLCRALIDKVKIRTNHRQNCTISVKRKILQILPIFLSKANDYTLWQDVLTLINLYLPVSHDYSQDGASFLLSLVESLGEIEYNSHFSYYFEQFHNTMLQILRFVPNRPAQKQMQLKMVLFGSLMQWPSRYSFQILEEVTMELQICRKQVLQNINLLKVIFKQLFKYLALLKIEKLPMVTELIRLTQQMTKNDSTHQLFSIRFGYDLAVMEQQLEPFQFLKKTFGLLQEFKQLSMNKYGMGLRTLKERLNFNKKMWGLQLQLTLSENKAYFLAEYLWLQLTSDMVLRHSFVRLQLIKIYRIFYFYHIPIVTLSKLNKNYQTKQFPWLSPAMTEDILKNLKCFFPDIKWFSGYDSRSAKQLKAKYQQMNENRRKKKTEQYFFSQNNAITNYVRAHPGRESWDQLGREAIRIFISIYEDKQQHCDGKEAERFKSIQQGFKRIQQKLKRGRMPDYYNYEQLKSQVGLLMEECKQRQQRIQDIFVMVDRALTQISKQKERRQAELRDQMRIVISLDSIREQQEEDQQQQQQKEADPEGEDEFLFNEQVQENENEAGRVQDQDQIYADN